MGAVVGRAPAAARAGAALRREHLLSRAPHARVFRDAAGAGDRRRAARTGSASVRCSSTTSSFCPDSSCRASASRCSCGISRATSGAGVVGRASSSRFCRTGSITTRTCSCSRRSSSRWRCGRSTRLLDTRTPAPRGAAGALRRRADADVHLLRHLSDSVHGRRLRRDAGCRIWPLARRRDRGARRSPPRVALIAVVPVGRAYLGARDVVGERGRSGRWRTAARRGATTWGRRRSNVAVRPRAGALRRSRAAAVSRASSPSLLAVVALWPRLRWSGEHCAARCRSSRTASACCSRSIVSLGFNGFTYLRAVRLRPAVSRPADSRAHGRDGRASRSRCSPASAWRAFERLRRSAAARRAMIVRARAADARRRTHRSRSTCGRSR